MWKKLVVVGLLVTAGVVAAKSSSYVGTLVQNFRKHAAGHVPRSFEIDRVRYQISKLDDEIKAKFGPIAEKMAAAEDLSAEIKAGRASLDNQAKKLEELTKQVDAKSEFVMHDGGKLTAIEARAKMARDYHFFKQTRTVLEQKEKRLKTLETTIARAKLQVERLYGQKVEFERQLAELELREQELALEKDRAPAQGNDDLISDIKTTLSSIKRSQNVDQAKIKLAREFDGKVNTPDPNTVTPVTTEEVRRGISGKTTPEMPKVATRVDGE